MLESVRFGAKRTDKLPHHDFLGLRRIALQDATADTFVTVSGPGELTYYTGDDIAPARKRTKALQQQAVTSVRKQIDRDVAAGDIPVSLKAIAFSPEAVVEEAPEGAFTEQALISEVCRNVPDLGQETNEQRLKKRVDRGEFIAEGVHSERVSQIIRRAVAALGIDTKGLSDPAIMAVAMGQMRNPVKAAILAEALATGNKTATLA